MKNYSLFSLSNFPCFLSSGLLLFLFSSLSHHVFFLYNLTFTPSLLVTSQFISPGLLLSPFLNCLILNCLLSSCLLSLVLSHLFFVSSHLLCCPIVLLFNLSHQHCPHIVSSALISNSSLSHLVFSFRLFSSFLI